jgi:uncharacterized protein (DUF433 family)
MEWKKRIVTDPEILSGKPIIRGTRLAADFLLDLLASGWTKQQMLENYPQVSEEDINALFSYAAARLRDEDIFVFPDGTSG